MAILDVLRQAATVIGLQVPDAVFSSTAREHVELQALSNEMAERIAFDSGHDWSKLKTLGTISGDGLATVYDMPADYRRMLKKTSLWPSATPFTRLVHYPDTDQWLGMEVQNFQQTIGGWTLIGEQIGIKPAIPAGGNVRFYYLTDRIINTANGTRASSFMADTDSFRLNERLLKLGIIWQWKANKGQAYAEDMTNYEEALAYSIGTDKGSNVLEVRRGRLTAEAWPYPGVLGR